MTNAIDRVAQQAPVAPHLSQMTAVEVSRAVAEVQAAILVAQQFPRNMSRAFAEMRAACSRKALADQAFYTVPGRGTNKPSVHLARELARIWGNLDYGVRELARDDQRGESEVQAFAWDQQTNVRITRSMIVPHARMKGKNRQELTDLGDIYLNNQNQGARAVRECVFAALSKEFVNEAQDLCRATIEKGDGQPLEERIAVMVQAFNDIGVTVKQIEARMNRAQSRWDAADVADLGVVFNSIRRRETTIDQEFPETFTTDQLVGGEPE